MVALAERLRLELDSSDRKNLVGSQIIPDKLGYRHVILFRFACPACALIRSFAFELDQSSIVVSYKSTYWPKRFVV